MSPVRVRLPVVDDPAVLVREEVFGLVLHVKKMFWCVLVCFGVIYRDLVFGALMAGWLG
jgi:hypothetical protein